ncbi:hypothetical protein ACIOWB_24310 [Pseudomonas capeferrum]|uniref:hypothetical protein n=1 Tax=Pseudomonas capeferrum TaxID=1495066 RepID=UPI0038210693
MDNATLNLRVDVLQQFQGFLDGCAGRIKWASVNAIHHLRKAVEISEIDPSMAAFRAVCAEEEAATALISSLKEQCYEGADKLYFRNHADKHAVILFVGTVMQWFQSRKAQAGDHFGHHRIFFDDIDGRVGLHFSIQLGRSNTAVNPVPPLHLVVQGPRTLEEEFQDEMKDLLGLERIHEIRRLIDQRANFRNTLLYATTEGIPKSDGDVKEFIENQIGLVNNLLMALALIDPWRRPDYPQSGIVSASIGVFVDLMDRVKKEKT